MTLLLHLWICPYIVYNLHMVSLQTDVQHDIVSRRLGKTCLSVTGIVCVSVSVVTPNKRIPMHVTNLSLYLCLCICVYFDQTYRALMHATCLSLCHCLFLYFHPKTSAYASHNPLSLSLSLSLYLNIFWPNKTSTYTCHIYVSSLSLSLSLC